MLQNLQIRTRILILIAVPAFALVGLAVSNQFGAYFSDKALEEIHSRSALQRAAASLAEELRSGLVRTVHQVNSGSITWETAAGGLSQAKRRVDSAWRKHVWATNIDNDVGTPLRSSAKASLDAALADLELIMNTRDRKKLELFVINDFDQLLAPMFSYLEEQQKESANAAQEAITSSHAVTRWLSIGTVVGSLAGLLISSILGYLVFRSIAKPVHQIAAVVRTVSEGDFNARTRLRSTDELGLLGRAFDQLLEERMATLAEVEKENESLNDSVIALLQAVAQISQRDLTVNVPVAADVTGAVADALNQLTQETANVLQGVTDISADVASASAKVKAKSDSVLALAATERQQVLTAARELNETAEALQQIAALAGNTNEAAESAIAKTKLALESVVSTVEGINSSRDTIRETEKRIKRLGERSQEISIAVNLINNIAERTHILALNASMHAASAGEAGRGFAVVADEVQRLAESARHATSQIANLVTNIQTETADTVSAMNAAIGQVVEGSRLAEEAGERMRETQNTTEHLVEAVREIAASSQTQAQSSQTLREHARQIETSTKETSEMLNVQAQHTNRLVQYAKRLIASVQVFRLPERKGMVGEVLDKAA